MRNKLTILFTFMVLSSTLSGQDIHHKQQDVDTVKHGSFNPHEAVTFSEMFKKGKTAGMLRSSSMFTLNEGDLADHGALALGGRLYYHTAYWNGLQFGLGGLYIYNLHSSDLHEADPLANRLPIWEIQLFDVTDPHNKHDLDRLEELFIKYRYKDSYIKYGKMVINTPLVNAQDSRMKPTAMNGLWFDWNEGHQFELNGGWFTKTSPRSTTQWYDIRESIGIYGTGVNPDGTPSAYADSLHTEGLLILGGHIKSKNEKVKVHLWQYHITNILRTTFFQVDYFHHHMDLGLQYIHQFMAGNGGNEAYANRYFHAEDPVHIISGKWEYDYNHFRVSVNGTYTLSDGRFIFPRELGTANLFTFISRHRVEGLGNFNTHTLKLNYYPLKNRSLDLGLYFAHTETSLNPARNKYGMPTLNQVNFDAKYHFENALDGLDLRLLTTVIGGTTSDNPEHIFYKTNLLHMNLVATFQF